MTTPEMYQAADRRLAELLGYDTTGVEWDESPEIGHDSDCSQRLTARWGCWSGQRKGKKWPYEFCGDEWLPGWCTDSADAVELMVDHGVKVQATESAAVAHLRPTDPVLVERFDHHDGDKRAAARYVSVRAVIKKLEAA